MHILLARTSCRISVLFAVLALLAFSAYAQTTQQIVDGFYPARLLNSNYSLHSPSPVRNSCFVNYDSQTVVAAYSDSIIGDILVLQIGQDGQYHQIYETPPNLRLLGGQCSIELVPVGGNVGNAIFVSYQALNRNDLDWVFAWDGTQLKNLIPTTAYNSRYSPSFVTSASVVDLYHDGSLQLIGVGEYPPPLDGSPILVGNSLYRLQNGVFQRVANPSLDLEIISQTSNTVQQQIGNFQRPRTVPGPYTIKVTNGNRGGSGRVTSGSITINGIVVGTFTSADEFASSNIGGLQDNNKIQITTSGPQGSAAIVEIEGQPSGDVNLDGVVDCGDLTIVRASFGKRTGQAGFDPRADVNLDGVVNALDLAIVARQLPAGTSCK